MSRQSLWSYALILSIAIGSPISVWAGPNKIQMDLVQTGPVICHDDSIVIELETRIINVSGSTIKLGRVSESAYRLYAMSSTGKPVNVLRTEGMNEGVSAMPSFDISAGKYEVSTELLEPKETKAFDEKMGFQVESGDILQDNQGRRLTVSVYVTNILPETPFGRVEWGQWTKPIVIWIPRECKLEARVDK